MLKGEKKKVNLENRSLEKEGFADRGRFRAKWEHKEIGWKVQKKKRSEKCNLAPFYLNINFRLVLLEFNSGSYHFSEKVWGARRWFTHHLLKY